MNVGSTRAVTIWLVDRGKVLSAAALCGLLVLGACGKSSSPGSSTPSTCASADQCLEGGLGVQDIKVGTGATAQKGDQLEVLYTGMLANGRVFDASSRHGNKPLPFTLGAGSVIAGWDEGVVGMKVGGERKLTIPSKLGYGASGYPPVIPANATLIFDIKLLKVTPGP